MLIGHTFDVAMAIRARRRQLRLRQIEVAKAAKVAANGWSTSSTASPRWNSAW